MNTVLFKLLMMMDEAPSMRAVSAMERDIAEKHDQGWTDREIFNEMRWIEECSPEVAEEYAISRMKNATKMAKARIALDKLKDIV